MECVLYHSLNSTRQGIGQRFKYPATGTFVIAFRRERENVAQTVADVICKAIVVDRKAAVRVYVVYIYIYIYVYI